MKAMIFALALATIILASACSQPPEQAAPPPGVAPVAAPPMPVVGQDPGLESDAESADANGPRSGPGGTDVVPVPGLDALRPEGPGPPKDGDAKGYCASMKSEVYHRCDCSVAGMIQPGNMVRFGTREEAEESGRRSCMICNP